MLTADQIASLQDGKCPDCLGGDLVGGPRGGLGQNIACRHCGAEFNVARATLDHGQPGGPVVMAHRNSAREGPNRPRLREVFGIELPPPAREIAAAAYFNMGYPDRLCDRDGCGEHYRGPSVYCSLRCTELDA